VKGIDQRIAELPSEKLALLLEWLGTVEWLKAREITVSFLPIPLAESVLGLDAVDVPTFRLLTNGGALLHRRPRPGSGWSTCMGRRRVPS
jgi:hypothetical protein